MTSRSITLEPGEIQGVKVRGKRRVDGDIIIATEDGNRRFDDWPDTVNIPRNKFELKDIQVPPIEQLQEDQEELDEIGIEQIEIGIYE